jgi:hypothetical protein
VECAPLEMQFLALFAHPLLTLPTVCVCVCVCLCVCVCVYVKVCLWGGGDGGGGDLASCLVRNPPC